MQNTGTSSSIWIAVILVLFMAGSLAYSIIVPPFNTPDEHHHFEYIRFLAEEGTLPNQLIPEGSISHEGFNPPLYYLVNALFLRISSPEGTPDIITPGRKDFSDFEKQPARGFRQAIFPPLNPNSMKFGGTEKNTYLTVPLKSSLRPIHLLRIISVIFGSLTVYFIYRTALLFFENNATALLATSIAAFNPQFNFISGSLNNDNLVILFSTLALFFLTRLMVCPAMDKKSLVALGCCIGLGLISKVNISSIAVVSAVAISFKSLKMEEDRWNNLLRNMVIFLLPAIALSGWFFLRNTLIYGMNDPLGWQLRAAQNPELILPPELRAIFFKEVFFQRLFTSFWGHFDWLTIYLPSPFYRVYGLLSLMAPFGIVALLKKGSGPQKACLAIYMICLLLSFTNLVILNFTFLSAQSRLLFPSIGAVAIVIGAGVAYLLKVFEKRSNISSALTGTAFMALLFAMNIYALAKVIYPVYH